MKAAGADVIGFQRIAVGEGVEKVVEDYAAEVAKAIDTAISVLTTLTATNVDVTLPPGGFRSSGVYVNVRGPEAYTSCARCRRICRVIRRRF